MDSLPIYTSTGEPGSGSYSTSMPVTIGLLEDITPVILRAIDDVPYHPGDGPFTICDYGASDGGVSLPLVRACVDRVRSIHGKDAEVLLVYEDLPTNDTASLVKNLYVRDHVYASIVARSFYEQCCPSASVHLGFSVMSVVWLSRRPAAVDDAIFAYLSKDEEAFNKYKDQAARDWENFLECRAKELVSGGRLFVTLLSGGEDAQPYMPIYHAMEEAWCNLLRERRITHEEYRCATIATYLRSTEENRAPFATPDSAGRKAGLVLVDAKTADSANGFHNFWSREDNDDTPTARQRFGQAVAGVLRPWSHTAFQYALSPTRTQAEKEVILSELYTRIADWAAGNVDDVIALRHRSGQVLIKKL